MERPWQRRRLCVLGLALVALSCLAPLTPAFAASDREGLSRAVAEQARPTHDAATCDKTVERFIQELDTVMGRNARSITIYQSVLAKHLFYRQGLPGMPSTIPGSSITGCHFDRLAEFARGSRFLYEIGTPPRYQHYRIEFRDGLAKVFFAFDQNTGSVFGADVGWIKPYP